MECFNCVKNTVKSFLRILQTHYIYIKKNLKILTSVHFIKYLYLNLFNAITPRCTHHTCIAPYDGCLKSLPPSLVYNILIVLRLNEWCCWLYIEWCTIIILCIRVPLKNICIMPRWYILYFILNTPACAYLMRRWEESYFPGHQHFNYLANYKDNKIERCILFYDKYRPFSLWHRTFEPFTHDIVLEINQSLFVTIYYEVWAYGFGFSIWVHIIFAICHTSLEFIGTIRQKFLSWKKLKFGWWLCKIDSLIW